MQIITHNNQKIRLRMADHFLSRLRGLLLSKPLAQDEGLLISPCNSIHTAWMRYSIDIVFINHTGQIQKIVPHLKPWRFALSVKAKQTLELAAGQAEVLGLKVGQPLQLLNAHG